MAGVTIGLLGLNVLGQAQIVISSSDMFNQAGQYYLAYANRGEVTVSGLLGTAGGPQAWDFTEGPKEVVYRFDYLPVAESGLAADFPQATFVERKTDQADGSQAWLFLRQVPGQGRENLGFHDPSFSDTYPTSVFTPSMIDFPDLIAFGDSWKAATTFDSEISFGDPGGGDEDDFGGGLFVIPTRISYAATATVDAYGIVNLPGIGFGECLRVNELTQWDIAVDFGLGDGYMTVATQYVRNYYWLRKGRGIVVQVTSRQLDVAPPNDFPVATALVRMFETNHPDGVVELPSIRGFKITLSGDGALLTWTKSAGTNNYRVEYSTGDGWQWQLLELTRANFALDKNANKPGVPTRFYRVVGTE
jgi:hypothetical protein